MNEIAIATNRILVIDDNPSIHQDFKKILMRESNSELEELAAAFLGESEDLASQNTTLDLQLDSAFQGEEGYQMVQAACEAGIPYQLAFCDMRMPPGWDGLETIANLWELDPKLHIVICSAYSDNSWEDISDRLGRSDRLLILKKPFDNSEVLQVVTALLEKHRLTTQFELRQEELEKAVADRTKHLNQTCRESELLINAISSLLIQLDSQGKIQRWNQSAEQVFSISFEKAVGKLLTELPINWCDTESAHSMLRQLNLSATRFEEKFEDEDEGIRIVGFSSYPIVEAEHQLGTLILGTELTKRFIMEQQLHQAQKLESVGQLAAGVAHEVNTPMQYIGDNLDYLRSKFEKLVAYVKKSGDLLDAAEQSEFQPNMVSDLKEIAQKIKLKRVYEQIPEALEDSIDGVGHVSRIVRALKELSHPGGDEMAPVDINKVLDTTITVSTNEWKYVAEIELDLEPELEMIPGHLGELSQVFLNLIVNAAHAIGEITNSGNDGKGKIMLSTRKLDDVIRISIQDSGGGIPHHIQKKIFDPFFTTKPVGKGTGQGLAIAHTIIVQQHSGNIWFEVEEGKGTTFYIELPRHEAKQINQDENPKQSEGA